MKTFESRLLAKRIGRFQFFIGTITQGINLLPTIFLAKPIGDCYLLWSDRDFRYYGFQLSIRFLRFAIGISISTSKEEQ